MSDGESSDNKSGLDVDRAEKMHGQFPKKGFGKSVVKKDGRELSPEGAKKPKKASKSMRAHMKRGLVSQKQMDKASRG